MLNKKENLLNDVIEIINEVFESYCAEKELVQNVIDNYQEFVLELIETNFKIIDNKNKEKVVALIEGSFQEADIKDFVSTTYIEQRDALEYNDKYKLFTKKELNDNMFDIQELYETIRDHFYDDFEKNILKIRKDVLWSIKNHLYNNEC